MRENGEIAFSSLGPPLGERAVWDTEGPDHECECPGPPPKFYLPPPPRPPSLVDSDCSENSISDLETCEAVPVIDAEYHYSPAIPSLAIILIVTVAVVVFLFIGTFLVVLKKRKMQNLFPRKSSPQNRCDAASANGVIYEDLTNIRPRTLSPGQTTLPSIEMLDVTSYPNHGMFAPVFICPPSPMPDPYNSQDLFNPVYEELSNGSGERGETDSEGLPQAPVSEDEFAEDELSLGGEPEEIPRPDAKLDDGDFCRDVDSSDADDRSRFLGNFTMPPEHRDKGRRPSRGSHYHGGSKGPKSLDRRKNWRKPPPSTPAPPPPAGNFHEGLLLKRILQMYPDVTGVGLRGQPRIEEIPTSGRYESLPAQSRRPKPEIFSTFGAIQGKNQSQDSSLGSDSGYSNNTSGGKPTRTRKECRIANHSDPVLS